MQPHTLITLLKYTTLSQKTNNLSVSLLYHGVLGISVLLENMEMFFVISTSNADITDVTNWLWYSFRDDVHCKWLVENQYRLLWY